MMQNGGDNLHQTAAKGVEAINMLVGERDDLMTKNDRMERDIALMREKIAQLEGRLNVASAERDHYMRYCVELTTNLNNIQSMINSAIEAAKHAAFKPTHVTRPEREDPVSEEDAKAIENLIQRLPQSQN
jgi:hypothetical protein